MDRRAPLPLLPMMAHHQKADMRDHLVAVQSIIAALATQDFFSVEQAALRMGYSEQMGRMCTHMGTGAPGFSQRALQFHHSADRIASPARAQDTAGVLAALAATLQTCTSCHATFKQKVVSEATWHHLASQ